MVIRTCRDVHIEPLEHGRFIVSGGCLKKDIVWMPNEDLLLDVDDMVFVKLMQSDASFGTLVGASMANNGFIDDLVNRREAACSAVLDELTRSRADLSRASPEKLRDARVQFLQRHEDKLPATVRIPIEGAPHEQLELKFEADKRKALAVRMDSAVLTFVVEQMRNSQGDGGRKRKRPKAERRSFKYKEVGWDEKRKVAFIRYLGADGIWRYHSRKVCEADGDCDEVAEELHSYYISNHTHATKDSSDAQRSCAQQSCAGSIEGDAEQSDHE